MRRLSLFRRIRVPKSPPVLAVVVAVAVTVVVGAHAPAWGLTPGDAGCRKALASAGSKLAAAVLKEQQRCHKVRITNADPVNYPASTNCNDVQALSAKAQAKITKAAAKLTSGALKKCDGVAGAPATLG